MMSVYMILLSYTLENTCRLLTFIRHWLLFPCAKSLSMLFKQPLPFNGSDVLMNSNILNSPFPIVNIQSNSLKRTRSENQRKFNASLAPPLPQIKSGDLILQVFTHKSLRRPNVTPEHYGDNERLADLGKVVLDAAITRTLFNSRPILQAAEISVC